MSVWDWWRILNISISLASIALNIIKMVQVRYLQTRPADDMLRFMSTLAWPLCYSIAVLIAWLPYGHQGTPATAVMTVPILWTLIPGLMRSSRRNDS